MRFNHHVQFKNNGQELIQVPLDLGFFLQQILLSLGQIRTSEHVWQEEAQSLIGKKSVEMKVRQYSTNNPNPHCILLVVSLRESFYYRFNLLLYAVLLTLCTSIDKVRSDYRVRLTIRMSSTPPCVE